MASDPSILTNSETDFFTAFSTVDGYVSFRHSKEGTYFTQTVLDVWEKHFNTARLQDLMQMVNQHRLLISILCHIQHGKNHMVLSMIFLESPKYFKHHMLPPMIFFRTTQKDKIFL